MKTARGFLVAAALLLFCAPPPLPAGQTMRLTSGEWAPYLSSYLINFGICSHIVAQSFAKSGINANIDFFPWKRAYVLARDSEKWDGSLVWISRPERQKDFYFSDEPVMAVPRAFYHLKTYAFDWRTAKDLHGLSMGGTLGYKYWDEIEKAEALGVLEIQRVVSDEMNLRKLLAGRIQVFPLELEVAGHLLLNHFSAAQGDRLTFHSKLLPNTQYYLILSRREPKNRDRMDKFNRGFKQLKRSGELDRYWKEYSNPIF